MHTYSIELKVKSETDPAGWNFLNQLPPGVSLLEVYANRTDTSQCAVCGAWIEDCAGCGSDLPSPHKAVCPEHADQFVPLG